MAGPTTAAATAALDPAANGPAPQEQGATKGGRLAVSLSSAPTDLDPSAQSSADSAAIMTRLMHRSLTTFVDRGGRQVLVPDLATDLGRQSDDGLTWTFTLKDGIRYSDGTAVTAKDVAYAVKRSLAFTDTGPAYLVRDLKGAGDPATGEQTYLGPFESGPDFPGVEAPDDKTVVFHLARRWQTLPYFASFTQVSPIPEAKDTKTTAYGDNAPTTGPYRIASYIEGSELVLDRNPHWDATTDPARPAYLDGYAFSFGIDPAQVQTDVLGDDEANASTLNWDPIDPSLTEQVTGDKSSRFVSGPSNCTIAVNLDTRKIPLEVRRALAVAYPWDSVNRAAGASSLTQTPAHTLVPPQVPGWLDYTLPGLDGKGDGDPARARQLLQAAGKENFELVVYYTNDDPSNVAQQVNAVRTEKLQAAGFTVTDLGVPARERRALVAALDGPHNINQAPTGHCYDWPVADSIFPATVSSTQIKDGTTNWGNLADPAVDAEMQRISALPLAQQATEWGSFARWLTETYLPVLPHYWDRSSIVFGAAVRGVVNDPNRGRPLLDAVWLDR